jgi:hypothetical protein
MGKGHKPGGVPARRRAKAETEVSTELCSPENSTK